MHRGPHGWYPKLQKSQPLFLLFLLLLWQVCHTLAALKEVSFCVALFFWPFLLPLSGQEMRSTSLLTLLLVGLLASAVIAQECTDDDYEGSYSKKKRISLLSDNFSDWFVQAQCRPDNTHDLVYYLKRNVTCTGGVHPKPPVFDLPCNIQILSRLRTHGEWSFFYYVTYYLWRRSILTSWHRSLCFVRLWYIHKRRRAYSYRMVSTICYSYDICVYWYIFL